MLGHYTVIAHTYRDDGTVGDKYERQYLESTSIDDAVADIDTFAFSNPETHSISYEVIK